jgi:hypothetical protein
MVYTWSGQTKDYIIAIYCFSTKQQQLSSKSKDWLEIQLSMLVNYKADTIIIQIVKIEKKALFTISKIHLDFVKCL